MLLFLSLHRCPSFETYQFSNHPCARNNYGYFSTPIIMQKEPAQFLVLTDSSSRFAIYFELYSTQWCDFNPGLEKNLTENQLDLMQNVAAVHVAIPIDLFSYCALFNAFKIKCATSARGMVLDFSGTPDSVSLYLPVKEALVKPIGRTIV